MLAGEARSGSNIHSRGHEPTLWPRVAIVVLNWNGWRHTIECLESVRQLTYPDYQVIVVDNGSTDESVDRLERWMQCEPRRVALVRNEENLGFAGGVNVAARRLLAASPRAHYAFLVNNDVRLETSAISECVKVSLDEDAAIVGAVIRSRDGVKTLFTGARFPRELFIADRAALVTQVEDRAPFWESGRAEASAMLVRHDLIVARLREFGYVFDPGLFMYFEEAELCQWAARRGHRVLMAGGAIAYHDVGGSTGGEGSPTSTYYLTRNRILLARRLLPLHRRLMFHLWYPASRVCRAVHRALEGNGPVGRAILGGLLDGYRGATGKWRRHPPHRSSQ